MNEQLGSAVATVLVEGVPPYGWAELPTKADLAAAIEGVRVEGRAEVAGLRAELKGDIAELRAGMRADVNRMLMWFVPTMFAGLAAMGAAIGAVVAAA